MYTQVVGHFTIFVYQYLSDIFLYEVAAHVYRSMQNPDVHDNVATATCKLVARLGNNIIVHCGI